MSKTHEEMSHEKNEALDKKYHFEKAEKKHLAKKAPKLGGIGHSLANLKKLVGESEQIRSGNFKHVLGKMK